MRSSGSRRTKLRSPTSRNESPAGGSEQQRRLHPALLVYTMRRGGRRRLVAQGSAARPPLALNHPLALSALAAMPSEFDRERAAAAWRSADIPEESHGELWAAFDGRLFVGESSEDGSGGTSSAGPRPAPTTWPPATTHFCRWTPGARGHATASAWRPTAARRPPRLLSAPRRRGRGRAFPARRRVAGRASSRHVAGGATRPSGIALLLDVCFGERGRLRVAGNGTCVLKSIPSGGARHPTEVFLAAFDLDGIPAGVYHYEVERHRLERVRSGQQRDAFARATLDLFVKHETPPAGALVFTSLLERAMWRYRDRGLFGRFSSTSATR